MGEHITLPFITQVLVTLLAIMKPFVPYLLIKVGVYIYLSLCLLRGSWFLVGLRSAVLAPSFTEDVVLFAAIFADFLLSWYQELKRHRTTPHKTSSATTSAIAIITRFSRAFSLLRILLFRAFTFPFCFLALVALFFVVSR